MTREAVGSEAKLGGLRRSFDHALGRAPLAGLVIGIVYTLSPLTVWFLIGIVPIGWYAARGLELEERRAVVLMFAIAVILRVATVAVLFMMTDHSRVAFGTFFGDEEYYINRSLWLRNLALGIPIRPQDLIGAFDPISASSHVYLLALLHLLVGPAPYGVHLFGILFYMLAVAVLYREVRSALGRAPALVGLGVLLFMPSLFAWSVSVLKEPVFTLIAALCVVSGIRLVKAATWTSRVVALAAIVLSAAGLESLRAGSAALSALGILIGLTVGYVSIRPRVLLAAAVAIPIAAGVLVGRPEVQLRVHTAVRTAASLHWGSLTMSRGYGYKLLDEHYYTEPSDIPNLGFGDAIRFLVRGLVAYVLVPLPWNAQSRTALAFLPEQIIWYLMVALAVAGVSSAFHRDAKVASLLLGFALVMAIPSALTDGNVGTLIRHRALALPYFCWLSGVGCCQLLS